MANIKGHKFKVEIRKNCKECGGPITRKRFRTYCSDTCANAAHYKTKVKKYGKKFLREQQREYLYLKTENNGKEKIQCKICGRWYRQVGIHIWYVHKMTAREYREIYGFDVKRGQLPEDLRELKEAHVFNNDTVKNLKKGKKFRFKKGDNGIGIYNRSEETLARLAVLHTYNKSRQKV